MAHECPDCFQVCHCGGDIDDIIFSDTKEELHCSHCPEEDDEDCEDDDMDDHFGSGYNGDCV